MHHNLTGEEKGGRGKQFMGAGGHINFLQPSAHDLVGRDQESSAWFVSGMGPVIRADFRVAPG